AAAAAALSWLCPTDWAAPILAGLLYALGLLGLRAIPAEVLTIVPERLRRRLPGRMGGQKPETLGIIPLLDSTIVSQAFSLMRIVVTGGAGFVGSNLIDRLMADGHTVTVLDNLTGGRRSFLERHAGSPRFTLHSVDVRRSARVADLLGAGTDLVYHLAA